MQSRLNRSQQTDDCIQAIHMTFLEPARLAAQPIPFNESKDPQQVIGCTSKFRSLIACQSVAVSQSIGDDSTVVASIGAPLPFGVLSRLSEIFNPASQLRTIGGEELSGYSIDRALGFVSCQS